MITTILITLIGVYFLIGITLFVTVILYCDKNIDRIDADDDDREFLDFVKDRVRHSPVSVFVAAFIFGFIWLPIVFADNEDR